MYGLTDFLFWISFAGFILAAFISYYIPGYLILKHVESQQSIRRILVALCIGFVLWTMQGYLFGYTQLRWLSYVYLLGIIVLFIPHRNHIIELCTFLISRIRQNKAIFVLILVGMVLQSQFMFGSGLMSSDGMRFHGVNNVDGLMHMGYIQKMMSTFPPNEPGAYYLMLKNYHYWTDLHIAEMARVWLLPAHHIFYQFIPLFFSLVTSAAVYVLMRMWTNVKSAAVWALFFLFFAGDAAYIFMLILHKNFGFHTPVIDNGIAQFYNMPHAAAKMVFITGLIAFYQWIKTKKKGWGVVTIMLFAPLVGFKVYFGLFAGLGLSLVVAAKIIHTFITTKKKHLGTRLQHTFSKELFNLMLLILFGIIAAVIFIPPNGNAGGLGYYPLEWPRLFLNSDNLDLREWWLRMQVYEQAGNTRNIIIYNTFAIVVALLCIHGTRILGFIPHKNLVRKLGWEHMVFFIPGIIIFHILGLTTLQKAGSFNVYNFFVVSTVIMALFTAYLLYELTRKKKWWAYLLIAVIVLVTIPRPIYEIYRATTTNIQNSAQLIPIAELDAFAFIRENTPEGSIVQSHPKNPLDNLSPYVAYFSNRDSFAAGIDVISAHNQPIKPNQQQLEAIFSLKDEKEFSIKLKEKGINYIYLQNSPEQKLPFEYNAKYLSKVYERDGIRIYQIK